MTEKINEKERTQRQEVYLMASRNPWMVWRLQAFRAGYVPPLLPGQIPPELANLSKNEEYHVEPLLEHTNRIKTRERKLILKLFTIIIIGILLIVGLSVSLSFKQKSRFRFGIIDAIIPRSEEIYNIDLQ